MGIFSRRRSEPRQPDLGFAADGFYPIAIMRANEIDVDLYSIADAYAESLLNDGCTVGQALSAKWGGVSAIGQNLAVYSSCISAYEETMAKAGSPVGKSKHATKAKHKAAATFLLAAVMSDAPGEYERFLQHINA